jgi:tetratricopeptide (TPR) repeat protein
MSIVVVLILVGAIIPQVTALIVLPRHVNPAEVQPEKPDPIALLALYGLSVEAASLGDYDLASSRLREAFKVYVPEDLKYIVGRFNELLDEELRLLNQTDSCIKACRNLLNLGLIDEAQNKADEGYGYLRKALMVYWELEEASNRLSRIIPVNLIPILNNLQKLINSYAEQLKNLRGDIAEKRLEGIVETRLRIWADKSEAWVGSQISISGILTDENGKGIPNRTVVVHAAGNSYEAATSTDGMFKADIQIPYVYRPEVTVYATFTPTGSDIGWLAWSKSNELKIRLLYETPMIQASLDKVEVKPLETVTVSGLVSPAELKIWVKAFGVKRELAPNPDGSFNLILTVPAYASDGIQKVEIGTYPKGRIAPTTQTLTLRVYRLPVSLTLHTPICTISGLSFEVSGAVSANGSPLSGARILIDGLGSHVEVRTDANGFFKAGLTIPHSLHTGWHPLTVTVKPKEPWLKEAHQTVAIPSVNAYMVAIPVALAIILARSVWPSKRKPKPPVREAPIKPPLPTPVESLQGVPAIYLAAVKLVESSTGVAMNPSDTIREYLSKIESLIGEAVIPFRKLSFMLEEEVYGGIQVSIDEAKSLLEEVKVRLKA